MIKINSVSFCFFFLVKFLSLKYSIISLEKVSANFKKQNNNVDRFYKKRNIPSVLGDK